MYSTLVFILIKTALNGSMDQIAVNYIHSSFPWATEDAAYRLAELARGHNIKSSALAIAIAQVSNSGDVSVIKKLIDDTNKEAATTSTDILNTTKKINKEVKKASSIIASNDAMNSMSELGLEAAKALDKLQEAGVNMLGNIAPGASKIVGVFAGSATKTLVTTASVAVVFSQLMTEQEKSTRGMIDLGLLATNPTLFNDLRDRVANFAMSIDDYSDIAVRTKQVMTRTSANAFEGQIKMATFIGEVQANKDGTISKFGLSPQDLARQLADETASLFAINEITELNNVGKKRVLDSFETANKMSLFMADNFGIQRSESMRLRTEARENAEFSTAMILNREYINKTYGENATKNIEESNDALAVIFGTSLGPAIAAETQLNRSNTLQDITFDTSALNNISSDFLSTLQRLGPEVTQEYLKLTQDAMTGKLDYTDALIGARKFVQMVATADISIGTDSTNLAATELAAVARSTPNIMKELTKAEVIAAAEDAATKAEQAGHPIDQIGAIAVAFKEAQNAITPGFDTMSAGFKSITDSGVTLGKTLDRLFGSENFSTPEERIAALEARYSESAHVAYYRSAENPNRNGRGSTFKRLQEKEAETQLIEANKNVNKLEEDLAAAKNIENNEERIIRIENSLKEAQETQNVKRTQLEDVASGRKTISLVSRNSDAAKIDSLDGGLLDFIGKGEGTYSASNRGTIGNKIQGSQMSGTQRGGKNLEDMTFEEIFAAQAIKDPNDKGRLFAVGKYQIIPSTMAEIFPHSGLKLSDTFSPENQDKLGTLLIVGNGDYAKRKNLSAYIRGESNDIREAMMDFAKEWASAPNPDTGNSYYGSGNKSSHSVEEVARILEDAREQYAKDASIKNNPIAEVAPSDTQSSLKTQIASLNQNVKQAEHQGDDEDSTKIIELRKKIAELDEQLTNETARLAAVVNADNVTQATAQS